MGIAWAAIRANKMRSVLATLGIVIGIVTVTLMGTAITGLNQSFMKSVSMVGADMLYVQRFDWFVDSHGAFEKMQKRRPLTRDMAGEIERQATLSRAAAPTVQGQFPISSGKRKSNSVYVVGTTERMAETSGAHALVAEGRYLSKTDSDGSRPVCVIGKDVADNLFPGVSAVGKRIQIDKPAFEVIGVLGKQGSFLGLFSLDNQAIIPIQQFEAHFWRNPDCDIHVKAASVADVEDAREELRAVMRKIRRLEPGQPDDFSINQQDQFVRMFRQVAGTIALVGLFVTSLSLFVGGIGIMNIMFVSVAERTREIGIRKAIGAKSRAILVQFLIESAAICLIGGLIGVGIAWVVTLIISKFFPAAMSIPVAALALSTSLVTGVLSGVVPAWRAAKLNPVDALRNE
jgi:putative ABC transport system permease protein